LQSIWIGFDWIILSNEHMKNTVSRNQEEFQSYSPYFLPGYQIGQCPVSGQFIAVGPVGTILPYFSKFM
jgi:hypothetical protein